MNAKKFISELPEEEISPTIIKLIDFIQQQSEELQALRDEIARLKGQKPKPKIKASNLDKKTKQTSEKRDVKPKQKKKPEPNQLSQQQIEQLLEAMNNEENKTQQKVNAQKAKGKKVDQEKDW